MNIIFLFNLILRRVMATDKIKRSPALWNRMNDFRFRNDISNATYRLVTYNLDGKPRYIQALRQRY